MSTDSVGGNEPKPKGRSRKHVTPASPTYWVGVAVLVFWLGLVAYLAYLARSVNDGTWGRLVWLFGSVEAIVFAAAGALFGVSVQRDHVIQAQDQADQARRRASANEQQAANGRALATALRADVITHADSPNAGDLSARMPRGADGAVARHAALANALFPAGQET